VVARPGPGDELEVARHHHGLGGGRLPAPAEHHNPAPISFLTVTGAFAVDLYGPDAGDVAKAAQWLIDAGAELGAGAKTAAGYGYLKLTWLERPEDLR